MAAHTLSGTHRLTSHLSRTTIAGAIIVGLIPSVSRQLELVCRIAQLRAGLSSVAAAAFRAASSQAFQSWQFWGSRLLKLRVRRALTSSPEHAASQPSNSLSKRTAAPPLNSGVRLAMSDLGRLNLLAYFSGRQPFTWALLFSLLVWMACWAFYALAVSSAAAYTSWAPTRLAMGVALPAIGSTLWVLWHCASQVTPVALQLALRGLLSAVAFGFACIALLLFLAGFVNPSVAFAGLSAGAILAGWATLREQWRPNRSSKRTR